MAPTTAPHSRKPFIVVDLFCGAGGSTSGVAEACEELGLNYRLICINHWDQAISTHSANHPNAVHLCTAIDNVDPRKVVPGGRVHLMWASPECTFFSMARGGRPMSDQSRASAWHVVRWAEALYVDAICIENVREFQNYGPLGIDGRPIKSKQGETFRAFIEALRSLSYRVEFKVLRAADYGDPTTRERLFLLARRNNRKIVWPEPSHSPDGGSGLFGGKQKWRAAREIIDWSLPSTSIFTRKKPLATSTMRRIEAGIRKFCGEYAQPFLVLLRNHGEARSVEEPVPTLCAQGNHVGLAQPFVLPLRKGQAPRPVDAPLPTLTANDQLALCEPFVLPQQSGGVARSVTEPLPTVATKGAISVVEPVLTIEGPVQQDLPDGQHETPAGGSNAEDATPDPRTARRSSIAFCDPFLVEYHGSHPNRADGDVRIKSVDEPLPTQTCANRFGLAGRGAGETGTAPEARVLHPSPEPAAGQRASGLRPAPYGHSKQRGLWLGGALHYPD
jgi:DNA (cytosine-5)-methyltransferase 1